MQQGRVEIWYSNQWNTVCDDSWDINDATVVCRQLGYRGAVTAHQSAHFGQGSGQILLDDLHCTGSEASLLECSHAGINVHNCGHGEDASVTCECISVWVHATVHSLNDTHMCTFTCNITGTTSRFSSRYLRLTNGNISFTSICMCSYPNVWHCFKMWQETFSSTCQFNYKGYVDLYFCTTNGTKHRITILMYLSMR